MIDDTAHADPAPDAPRLPRLAPAATATTSGRAAVLRFETHAARGVPLMCMLNGRTLRHVIGSDGTLRLPSMPEEGVLFVARALTDAAAPPRPVLMTSDAAIAAEVAAAMPGGAKDSQDDAALATLGAAMRAGAQPELLRAAAAEALRRGWAAASTRLLRALREALDARTAARAQFEEDEEPERRQALLTTAVLGLNPGRVVPIVLREGGPACIFGSPVLPSPGGGEAYRNDLPTTVMNLAPRRPTGETKDVENEEARHNSKRADPHNCQSEQESTHKLRHLAIAVKNLESNEADCKRQHHDTHKEGIC
jgi:hypothetical protein